MGFFNKRKKDEIEELMDSMSGIKKDIIDNPDEYMVITFEYDMLLAKIVKGNKLTDELREAGKLLADKFKEEVLDEYQKLLVEFCKKYDIIPQSVLSSSSTMPFISMYMKTKSKELINKISGASE